MYQILDFENIDKYLNLVDIIKLSEIIEEQAALVLKKKKKENIIQGGFAIKDYISTSNEYTNIWIEFTMTYLNGDSTGFSVTNCILFDEDIPDIVLDKYNKLKSKKYESTNS